MTRTLKQLYLDKDTDASVLQFWEKGRCDELRSQHSENIQTLPSVTGPGHLCCRLTSVWGSEGLPCPPGTTGPLGSVSGGRQGVAAAAPGCEPLALSPETIL